MIDGLVRGTKETELPRVIHNRRIAGRNRGGQPICDHDLEKATEKFWPNRRGCRSKIYGFR